MTDRSQLEETLHRLLINQARTRHEYLVARAEAFLRFNRPKVTVAEVRARAVVATAEKAQAAWKADVEARLALLLLDVEPGPDQEDDEAW